MQYDFDDAEMDRIAGLARLQLDDAKEDLEDEKENQPAGDSVVSSLRKSGGDEDEDLANDADLKEYDLEHYDDDEEETGENMGMFSNLRLSHTMTMVRRIHTFRFLRRKKKRKRDKSGRFTPPTI